MSPPAHYVEEAADLLARISAAHRGPSETMLELGSGGGSLAHHLKSHARLTLTDLSPDMLNVSRTVNPECEHVEGDMRTLRLDRKFDLVLLHDAVMYMTSPDDLLAALTTAAVHCRPGGSIFVLPDHVKETFEPGTDHGGEDGPDGRALRYMDWMWDPDPSDDTYVVDYAYVLRTPDGHATSEYERHVEGMFPRATWFELAEQAGMPATSSRDAWGRDVFVGHPRER